MHFPELTEIGFLTGEMASAVMPSADNLTDYKKILDANPGEGFQYNFYIDQNNLINYCALHNVFGIISGTNEKTKLNKFDIIYKDIVIEYPAASNPSCFKEAAAGIGKWKDQQFNYEGRRITRTVGIPEAFSGNDMVDLFYHLRVTRSASPADRTAHMPEQDRPKTLRALKQALGIPPFITTHDLLDSRLPQILCQDALDLEKWDILNSGVVDRDFFQNTPPLWIARYLLTPHFFYELCAEDNLPAFRAARWIIPTEHGLYNFYMLYAAMRSPPGRSPWLPAWLPAPLPEKLHPHNAAQLDSLPPSAPVIVTRDLHIEVPSEISSPPCAHIAYPGSIARITPAHILWNSLQSRQVYLLLDTATPSAMDDVLSLYREIRLVAPMSLEIIWKRPTQLKTQPSPDGGSLWVKINAEALQGFLNICEKADSDKTIQNQRYTAIKSRTRPSSGEIYLLHGAPTIGATTFSLHVSLAWSRGESTFINITQPIEASCVLFISYNSKETDLQKLSNISPSNLPEKFRLLNIGDITPPPPEPVTENQELLVALTWADVVFMDSPENNPTKGASPWPHIFRLASRLKEEGKLVVVVTHSDEMPRIRQFLHHTDNISRITYPGTDEHNVRDIINEFPGSFQGKKEFFNTRYKTTPKGNEKYLYLINKNLSDDDIYIKNIRDDNILSLEEKCILLHLIKIGRSSLSSIKFKSKIGKRTKNNIAKKLVLLNLIEMTGKGRATKYGISRASILIRYMKRDDY